jgi:hypothetical protein
MWHGMMSAAYVADDISSVQKRCMADDMGESYCDTWHALVGCKCATWPNHGLPCGTPVLVNMVYVKSFWSPGDSNPGPPHRNAFVMSLRPLYHALILVSYVCYNLFKFEY